MVVEEKTDNDEDDDIDESDAFIPDDDDDDDDELFLSLITVGSSCNISIIIALRPLINGRN